MNSQAYGLLLHNDYTTTYCAITHRNSIVAQEMHPNRDAARCLMPTIATLLHSVHLELQSCAYIAVNRGPTPFTTLRTVISTANGLGYATGAPLVGVDGIHAFGHQTHAPNCTHVLVLLHAFRHDVYYGLYDQHKQTVMYGWSSFDTFHEHLEEFAQSHYTSPRIYCVGNGVQDHYMTLTNATNYEATIDHPIPTYADITHIMHTAYEQWHNNETTHMLTPLYLKKTQAYLHQ